MRGHRLEDAAVIEFEMFWRGLILGVSIAAPVGPIGILVIQRSLAHGRRAGFFSGLGAAGADAVYGAVAALGLAGLAAFLVSMQRWLGLLGGLFLLYLGAKILLTPPVKFDLPGAAPESKPRKNLFSMAASTFALTLSNPMTILSFVAVYGGLGLAEAGRAFGDAVVLVAGVFAGSAAWWLFLSQAAGHPRWRMYLGDRGRGWINRVSGAIILVFGLVVLANLVSSPGGEPAGQRKDPAVAGLQVAALDGFARAAPGVPLIFPQDFGPHPDYQTEWWYYTGNLAGPDGQRFGYQLTFFRRALLPPTLRSPRASDWAADQVYLAHFAITDAASNQHFATEKLARGAAGLAGAQADPYTVWLENWQVIELAPGRYRLTASLPAGESNPALSLSLELADTKGPVLQGVAGYSQKGPEPGNASFYYSQTRLETSGTLTMGARTIPVSGFSWKDHEYSTSALAANQTGWDWFSIQLDDGSELMFFQLRRDDGSIDPFSSGALITPEGQVVRLSKEDFTIEVLDTWTSPTSRGVYPAAWQVNIPGAGLTLEILPLVADQEMDLQYTYWEGAVRVRGVREGRPLSGYGYVEMTGYAGIMAGDF